MIWRIFTFQTCINLKYQLTITIDKVESKLTTNELIKKKKETKRQSGIHRSFTTRSSVSAWLCVVCACVKEFRGSIVHKVLRNRQKTRSLPECGFSFSSRRDRRICGRQSCRKWIAARRMRKSGYKENNDNRIQKGYVSNEATNSCEQKTVFFPHSCVYMCVCVCACLFRF